MAHTACLVCLFSAVIGRSRKKEKKKAKNALEGVALVVST
jgi:hypothetical protein